MLTALLLSVLSASLEIQGDGQTDDTAAIQAALDAAALESPGEVHLPAGKYLIEGTLYVPAHTTLRGDYMGPGRRKGTVLLATGGEGRADGPGCVVLRDGMACLRNMAIEYPKQRDDAEEPLTYPYAIQGGHSARIEEVYLHNAYQGIDLDAAHANLVRNVWGEPLRVGINVNHCYDVSRIENVHFWPYFTNNKPLRAWVQNNGVAFQFGRSDWQYALNLFCYGYHTGVRFYRTDGVPEKNYPAGTTNGNFVGIGVDRCVVGVDVEHAFEIGVSFTNCFFAPFGAVDERAIHLHEGNQGNLCFTNCNFWAVTSALAEVAGGSLTLSGCNIQEWALLTKERPCFILRDGRLNVSNCTFNQGGLLAELEGETARANITGNTSEAPLQVRSGIGERAVLGLNNPRIRPDTGPQ